MRVPHGSERRTPAEEAGVRVTTRRSLIGETCGRRLRTFESGDSHWGEWLAELLGTALFFAVGFSIVALILSPRSPVSDDIPRDIRFLMVGLNFGVLAAAIALSPLGRRSGAHLNPAVTLGFWLRGDVHRHDLFAYAIAQFAGALAGTAAFGFATGSWAESISHARTSPASVGLLWAVAIEAAITFGLLVPIFAALSSRRFARYTPVAVVVVLALLIWGASPPTGASMNPARSLAPAIIEQDFRSLWVYFVGPAIGAVAAALAFRVMNVRTATTKLFHDPRYRCTMRTRLPARP